MPTTIPFEDDILKLLFQAVAIQGIAINHTTTPLTSFYVSLCKADPILPTNQVQDQLTSEVFYTGYARVLVPRNPLGWKVGGGMVTAVNVIAFTIPTDIVQPFYATHFAIGGAASGAGKLIASGKLVPPIQIANGIEPRIDNKTPAARMPDDWV
jgi:hypothetical protein